MMRKQRLQQFTISLLIVLSLFVSAVAACACSHHEERAETEVSSCHGASPETKTETHPAASAETHQTAISEAGCPCIQPAPRVVSKNENLKLEKQPAAFLPKTPLDIKQTWRVIPVKTIELEPPFYLSDSFYNLSPPRAPPSRL